MSDDAYRSVEEDSLFVFVCSGYGSREITQIVNKFLKLLKDKKATVKKMHHTYYTGNAVMVEYYAKDEIDFKY